MLVTLLSIFLIINTAFLILVSRRYNQRREEMRGIVESFDMRNRQVFKEDGSVYNHGDGRNPS